MKWTKPLFRQLLQSKLPYRNESLYRSELLYLSESLIKSLCIRAYFQYQSMSPRQSMPLCRKKKPKEALL